MNYLQKYIYWKTNEFFDRETQMELETLDLINDCREIEDRFYRDLKFGTGGLRAYMGAGTNRINKYTIGKTTQGFALYLIDKYGLNECKKRGISIGYDTRNHSFEFAKITANILSSFGIPSFLHDIPIPTPQLSFSIRFFNTLGGIVITASHNPKEYNGYKIYDEDGVQLIPTEAKKVADFINKVKNYNTLDFIGNKSIIQLVNTTNSFVFEVLKQSRIKNLSNKANLKIVYTPLHGAGLIPINKVLNLDGFKHVITVKEQAKQDGNFSTLKSPNPEDKEALNMGIDLALKVNADIVIGTDPDCDRVGIAIKTKNNSYKLLSGNQVGALLVDFIIKHTDFNVIKNPLIINTIVTSELGKIIANKNGVKVLTTLTGFKYIGEKISTFENQKLKYNRSEYDFLFGYEESYGYLIGTHARDKDAVVATMLICEMAAEAKSKSNTLDCILNNIYEKYGYMKDYLDTFQFDGKEGIEKISRIMKLLRSEQNTFPETVKVIDYLNNNGDDSSLNVLPSSNVIKFILKDNSWIAARPSGTEPKLKIYYSILGKDSDEANVKLELLRNILKEKIYNS